MCFIIGQLIAAGVLEGLVDLDSEWSYRIPYALQWIWPAFLIPLIFFAPESPGTWSAKADWSRLRNLCVRLQSKKANIDPKQTLATIVHANKLEVELSGGTSYWDCFKGFERRRIEIACVVFAGQITSGIVGLTTAQTYRLNVGGNSLAFLGTLCNWFLVMPYFGSRTIYVWGMFTMTVILFIIGILNVWTSNDSVAMTQAVLTLIWTFVFQLSVGQLGWALPAEIGSTRLRQKTVCLARNTFYLVSFLGTLQPYFMNPTKWNLKGYTGFVWGGTALLTFTWAYFRLPETKGRSFEQIDILFAKGVPARKFKSYEVDAYNEHENAKLAHGGSVELGHKVEEYFIENLDRTGANA